MIAAFATFVFVASIWAIVVIGSMVLEQRGGKIRAALRGQSLGSGFATAQIRVRRVRQEPAMRAQPRLRAAA